MARPKNAVPALTHHKPSGQARVRVGGRDFYLGPHGSAQAMQAYGRLIADLGAGKLPEAALADRQTPTGERPALSVSELVLAFQRHAEAYYVGADGRITDEVHCFRSACRPLRELYGATAVDEFGPLALRAVRKRMVESGWSRGYVNKSVNRIRSVFRWGVGHELVKPATLEALRSVEGLRAGKTAAPDHPKRRPVPQEHIDAVKAEARTQRTRDLIDVQLLTAARPGELLALTTAMIDRTGDVWTARLDRHKTAHRGKERTIYFGPQSQLILRRYLDDQRPERRLFPIRVDSWSHRLNAICDRLEIERFCPHRLRHTAATRLRAAHGLEVAQIMLGHAKADVTEIYAQKNHAAALEVARKVG
jgi:integrase